MNFKIDSHLSKKCYHYDMNQKLSDKELKKSFKVIRLLCGPMRFKIVFLLKKNSKGLTVTEIAQLLNASLSRISHQLRLLKEHKLVLAKKIDRKVLYTLKDHRIRKILPF